mmetsp:Transcript_88802/g.190653  ORF Transcript_88802/g.190653 Transcript_88802/m.190653 type:complete len:557 (-) Transcript_88802:106-1776(-)
MKTTRVRLILCIRLLLAPVTTASAAPPPPLDNSNCAVDTDAISNELSDFGSSDDGATAAGLFLLQRGATLLRRRSPDGISATTSAAPGKLTFPAPATANMALSPATASSAPADVAAPANLTASTDTANVQASSATTSVTAYAVAPANVTAPPNATAPAPLTAKPAPALPPALLSHSKAESWGAWVACPPGYQAVGLAQVSILEHADSTESQGGGLSGTECDASRGCRARCWGFDCAVVSRCANVTSLKLYSGRTGRASDTGSWGPGGDSRQVGGCLDGDVAMGIAKVDFPHRFGYPSDYSPGGWPNTVASRASASASVECDKEGCHTWCEGSGQGCAVEAMCAGKRDGDGRGGMDVLSGELWRGHSRAWGGYSTCPSGYEVLGPARIEGAQSVRSLECSALGCRVQCSSSDSGCAVAAQCAKVTSKVSSSSEIYSRATDSFAPPARSAWDGEAHGFVPYITPDPLHRHLDQAPPPPYSSEWSREYSPTMLPAVKPCLVNEWSEWSPCYPEAASFPRTSSFVRTRHREVVDKGSVGAYPCPYLSETRACRPRHGYGD